MKGLLINCPSKEAREDFLKSFLVQCKKSKTREGIFTFSDDGENIQCIEISDDTNGAISVALIMIKDHTTIKISGVGHCRLDPVVVPEGANVIIGATL